MYTFHIFSGVSKVFFFCLISKYIPYFVSLNTLGLESIKISWELILYFSMKIPDPGHRGDPLYRLQIFSRVSKIIFCFRSKQIPYLVSKYSESIKISWEFNSLFFYENKKFNHRGNPLYTFYIFRGNQS